MTIFARYQSRYEAAQEEEMSSGNTWTCAAATRRPTRASPSGC